MTTIQVTVTSLQGNHVAVCTLRDFLRRNDYSHSERADLISRLREHGSIREIFSTITLIGGAS